MAHYDPKDNYDINSEYFLQELACLQNLDNNALHRFRSYINSLSFGKKSWSLIQEYTSLPDITLDQDEINLLFGPKMGEKVLDLYHNLRSDHNDIQSYQNKLIKLKDEEQTSYFYNAYQKLNAADETSKIEVKNTDLFFNYFAKFFIQLGSLVGEDNPNNYRFNFTDYEPNLWQVRENSYLRFHVGPTFNELLRLMSVYFTAKNIKISNKSLHHFLSTTLDRQIDQGFIVPVFDLYGRRIFRKGATSPYDIHEHNLLNLLGLTPSFTDLKNIRAFLSDEQYKKVFSALESFEQSRCL